jgi:hypothetical protein
MDGRGSIPSMVKIFSRPAKKPTEPPIQRIQEIQEEISVGVNLPG